MKTSQGFTLIELLVVIAIIGILSSVVLTSLSSARSKGLDAASKSELSSMRAQSEVWADNNGGSYNTTSASKGGTCTSGDCTECNITGTAFSDSGNVTLLKSVYKRQGASSVSCAFGDSGDSFAVAFKEKAVTGKWWCMDSVAGAKERASALTAPAAATAAGC